MKFWKTSLLAQLVGYFSILSVVTVSIVSTAAYTRARTALERSVSDRLTVATSLKDYQLGKWVANQRQDVLFISQQPDIQKEIEVLLTQEITSPEYINAYARLERYFGELIKTKPNLKSFLVTDNGGFVVFATEKSRLGKFQPLGAPTTYFTRQGAKSIVPNFYSVPGTEKSAITFATPIVDRQEVTMGAIVINLDLVEVDELIRERTGLGESGETYLVAQARGKNIFISGEKTMKDFPDGIKSVGIESAIAKQDGIGLYTNYAGVPVIGVYRWLTDQNLALIAEMSQAEAFDPANRLARDILLIGLSSAGVLLVAVYLMSRRITQPLMAIADTAIQVAGGNLKSQAPVLTEDEIGLLARAFNQMIDQLSQSKDQLEIRIKSATAELQDTLANLGSIIDNIADGLLVTDPQGKITRFNPALSRLFNLGNLDLTGEMCSEIFSKEINALIAQANSNPGNIFTKEVSLAHNLIGKAVATAVLKEDEDTVDELAKVLVGTVILFRDITAEKEVDRMKTDFISTVSHELRTPLTSVLGFAKIIKKKLEENILPYVNSEDKKVQRAVSQVSENIEIIVSEGVRLTSLINDVLDIAKMEAGKTDWRMEPMSVVDVVERGIAATSALFTQKNLELIRDFGVGIPKNLGDQDRLIQVAINLLSNSIKFTDQGSITCRITHTQEEIIVSIIDTGMGISEVDQPKVFEKFKQVGDTLTDKPKGTGLGLPICKEIIEQHGGRIWVEGQIGVGSTFSFTLPVLEQNKTEITTIDREQFLLKLKQQIAEQNQHPQDRAKAVLVVDDDQSIRELLRQELSGEGYEVRQAVDGRDAIAQVKANKPDLLILDVKMPEISGFDVSAILKNDPEYMDIPIIILSVEDDQERGYSLGVDKYLTKPIDSSILLSEVKELLDQGISKKRVLVVDENMSTVNALSQVLQQKGYIVTEAYDSQELLERVRTERPDMIIINDLLSAEHELVQALQFDNGLKNIVLFLLSDRIPANGDTTIQH
jgi:signal transduction histidine kinase/DNA-binding response OmpR family regulator